MKTQSVLSHLKAYPLVHVSSRASSAQRDYLQARSRARAAARFARVSTLASQGSLLALNECERIALALRPSGPVVDARKVASENEIKRSRDRSQIMSANPAPRALEFINGFDITVRKSKGGLRPLADAKDAKDKGKAASYREAVRSFATNVANKHVRQSVMRCDHLRAEFVTEIESAVGEFFAVRLARFPKLASDLLARFSLGILSASTSRNLHRTARRACDARMSRMGGRSKLVEPSFFNLFCDFIAERSTELDAVFVNARIDYLLAIVRERGSRNGNEARAARAHVKLLEQAREYFLASIKGEAVSIPSAGLVPSFSEVGFNTCETRKASAAAQVSGPSQRLAARACAAKGPLTESKGEVIREARGQSLANSALYFRLARLAKFTGAADISAALGKASLR